MYVDSRRNRELGRVGKPYGYVAPRPEPEPTRWSRRLRGLEPVPDIPVPLPSTEMPREAAEVSLEVSGVMQFPDDISLAAVDVSIEATDLSDESGSPEVFFSPALLEGFHGKPLAVSTPRVALFNAHVTSVELEDTHSLSSEYMTALDNVTVEESRPNVEEWFLGVTSSWVVVDSRDGEGERMNDLSDEVELGQGVVTAPEVASPVAERVFPLPEVARGFGRWLFTRAVQAFRF